MLKKRLSVTCNVAVGIVKFWANFKYFLNLLQSSHTDKLSEKLEKMSVNVSVYFSSEAEIEKLQMQLELKDKVVPCNSGL